MPCRTAATPLARRQHARRRAGDRRRAPRTRRRAADRHDPAPDRRLRLALSRRAGAGAERPDWRTRVAADSPVIGAELVLAARKEMALDARATPSSAARRSARWATRATPRSSAPRRSSVASSAGRTTAGRRRSPPFSCSIAGALSAAFLAAASGNRERVEDVGEADREADRRIDGRQAEEHARVEPHRSRACSARRASACRGSRCPETRRRCASRRGRSASPTSSACLRHRARERQAVREHVVLAIADRRIRQDADAEIADDANRLHGLGAEQRHVEIGGVEAQAALVRRVRQLGGESDADRRPAGGLGQQSNLRRDDGVRDVVRARRRSPSAATPAARRVAVR